MPNSKHAGRKADVCVVAAGAVQSHKGRPSPGARNLRGLLLQAAATVNPKHQTIQDCCIIEGILSLVVKEAFSAGPKKYAWQVCATMILLPATATAPMGGCHLTMAQGLTGESIQIPLPVNYCAHWYVSWHSSL